LKTTMLLPSPQKAAFAVLAVCVALAAAAAAAEAPPGRSTLAEGPGGRTALTRWTLRGYQGSVAWYRTSFQAPRPGTYALSFASASFRASVWVDGHPLGSHRGPYLPFEPRAGLAAGTHTVVVRVDWRNPGAQTLEGFHRTWFNWGGLDGAVSVRAIGESELIDPTVQTTLRPAASDPRASSAMATVRVGVQVRNDGPSRTIAPEGTLTHGAQAIPLSFSGQIVEKGQTASMSTTVTVEHPALWSPSAPNLYELKLAVGRESSFFARVGLRQLSWGAGRVYINGRRLQLHGASLQEDAQGHGDALSPGDEDTLVSELKAIGANAVRSQHPLDSGLLERLDAAGILVWQGIGPVEGAGNWFSSTPSLLSGAEQQARTAALAARLHPSVLAWNLLDEVAGNGRSAAEVRYVQDMTRWLRANDPGRMIAVDVWGDHPPARPGALYREVDAVAETDYSGWYDSPQDTPSQLTAMMRSRLASMHRTFAGKVLAISEFGAESNTLNPSASPGSYGFQSRLLASHIAVYAADPMLSGMLIWDLRDYPLTPTFQGGSIHSKLPRLRLIEGINQKGLFTYGGSPKPAVGVVARLFRSLPGG
jgi:beta-galactosidase/beta-glucuronidase